MFFIIGLQRLPIALNTTCELRTSKNVNWVSKHALFLQEIYCDYNNRKRDASLILS